jgi:hypothetical protein
LGGGGGREVSQVVAGVQLRPSRMTMCFDAPASAQTSTRPDFPCSLCIPLASLGASLGLSTAIPFVYRSFTTQNTAVRLPGTLQKHINQLYLPQAHPVSFSRLAVLAKQVIHVPWYPYLEPSRQATCLRCASHCRAKPYTTAFLHRYHALGRAPCCGCMFHGLFRSVRTPINYIRLVHLRNNRIIRLDAETVASSSSFASSHAKRDVELLSESSITRACRAAVSRANTSNNNQGTGLQSGKRSDHHCPNYTAQYRKGCVQGRPNQAFRCFRS